MVRPPAFDCWVTHTSMGDDARNRARLQARRRPNIRPSTTVADLRPRAMTIYAVAADMKVAWRRGSVVGSERVFGDGARQPGRAGAREEEEGGAEGKPRYVPLQTPLQPGQPEECAVDRRGGWRD